MESPLVGGESERECEQITVVNPQCSSTASHLIEHIGSHDTKVDDIGASVMSDSIPVPMSEITTRTGT